MLGIDLEHLKNVRVIAHIDLDAFYAQVEQNLNPRLQSASVGVIQVCRPLTVANLCIE